MPVSSSPSACRCPWRVPGPERRRRTPPSVRCAAAATGRTACCSATAAMPGEPAFLTAAEERGPRPTRGTSTDLLGRRLGPRAALWSWAHLRTCTCSLAPGAAGPGSDGPALPPVGTTWSAWTPLSRRCPWTSGSVRDVPAPELPPFLQVVPPPRRPRGPEQGSQARRAGGLWVGGGSWGRASALPVWRAGCTSGPASPFLPDADPVTEEEVSLLLVDVVPTASRLRPREGRTRAIARTRQSERVRATVNRNRMSTARSIQVGALPRVWAPPGFRAGCPCSWVPSCGSIAGQGVGEETGGTWA